MRATVRPGVRRPRFTLPSRRGRTGVSCLQREHSRENTRDVLAEEVVMRRIVLAVIAAIVMAGGSIFAQAGGGAPMASRSSSAGPLAQSCGTPAAQPAAGRGQQPQPIFPARAVSRQASTPCRMLGRAQRPSQSVSRRRRLGPAARREEVGIDGERDDRTGRHDLGRRSVRQSRAPAGRPAPAPAPSVNPIFQFDTSGKLLKTLWRRPVRQPAQADGRQGRLPVDGRQRQPSGLQAQSGRQGPDDARQEGGRRAGPRRVRCADRSRVAPNGDIFVGDGHTGGGTAIGNARIMKFDKNGKFLKTWGKKGMGPASSTSSTRWRSIREDGCSSATVRTTASRFSIRTASSSRSGSSSAARAACTSTSRTDTLYVADSESRDGRTNTGLFVLPQTGYGFNPGTRRGIRIGSATGRFGEILHSRSVPVSVPGRVEPGRRRHRRSRGQRIWRGLPERREEIREEIGDERRHSPSPELS